MEFDPERKFVRVIELRPDGFVEFDFAIGEPEVFVEMILPPAAFDSFCEMNKVKFIRDKAKGEQGDWSWCLRDATERRIKF